MFNQHPHADFQFRKKQLYYVQFTDFLSIFFFKKGHYVLILSYQRRHKHPLRQRNDKDKAKKNGGFVQLKARLEILRCSVARLIETVALCEVR